MANLFEELARLQQSGAAMTPTGIGRGQRSAYDMPPYGAIGSEPVVLPPMQYDPRPVPTYGIPQHPPTGADIQKGVYDIATGAGGMHTLQDPTGDWNDPSTADPRELARIEEWAKGVRAQNQQDFRARPDIQGRQAAIDKKNEYNAAYGAGVPTHEFNPDGSVKTPAQKETERRVAALQAMGRGMETHDFNGATAKIGPDGRPYFSSNAPAPDAATEHLVAGSSGPGKIYKLGPDGKVLDEPALRSVEPAQRPTRNGQPETAVDRMLSRGVITKPEQAPDYIKGNRAKYAAELENRNARVDERGIARGLVNSGMPPMMAHREATMDRMLNELNGAEGAAKDVRMAQLMGPEAYAAYAQSKPREMDLRSAISAFSAGGGDLSQLPMLIRNWPAMQKQQGGGTPSGPATPTPVADMTPDEIASHTDIMDRIYGDADWVNNWPDMLSFDTEGTRVNRINNTLNSLPERVPPQFAVDYLTQRMGATAMRAWAEQHPSHPVAKLILTGQSAAPSHVLRGSQAGGGASADSQPIDRSGSPMAWMGAF